MQNVIAADAAGHQLPSSTNGPSEHENPKAVAVTFITEFMTVLPPEVKSSAARSHSRRPEGMLPSQFKCQNVGVNPVFRTTSLVLEVNCCMHISMESDMPDLKRRSPEHQPSIHYLTEAEKRSP